MTNREDVTANCPCAVCLCCGFCDWWNEIQFSDIKNNGKYTKEETNG